MKVIDRLVKGKISQTRCEDGIVVTEHFAAVIDGSTSKAAEPVMPGITNGRLAMTVVGDALRQLPATATMADFCQLATRLLRETCERQGIARERLADHPEERPTASAAVFSLHRHEVWLVGDCQCIVQGQYYDNPKPGEAPIAERRSRLIHLMLADGTATVDDLIRHDSARDIIVPDIVATCREQNKSFAVLDGFDVALQHVAVIETGEQGEVVLATDGYPFLYPSLEESETALQRLLCRDPLCIRDFLATKGLQGRNESFDDRAFLRIQLKIKN